MIGEISAMTKLETKRLILRPLAVGDAADIVKMAGDKDVARMTTRIPHPYTYDDALNFIAAVGDEPVFAITFNRRLIGCMGIHRAEKGEAEIGYWLGKAWWGRGFATEAARKIIRYGFHTLGLSRIVAGHFSDNPASKRVLRKCGFQATGQQQRFSASRDKEATCNMYALDRDAAERQGLI
jgi:RimJ/RimL family protein N-acetyltransferase